jgi:hypothetical protein
MNICTHYEARCENLLLFFYMLWRKNALFLIWDSSKFEICPEG